MTRKCLWIALFVMCQVSLAFCRSTVKPNVESKAISNDFILFPPLGASIAKTPEEYFAGDLGDFANRNASSKIFDGVDENQFKDYKGILKDKIQDLLKRKREEDKKIIENLRKITDYDIEKVKFDIKTNVIRKPAGIIGGGIVSLVLACCCCFCKLYGAKKEKRRKNSSIIPNKEWKTNGIHQQSIPGIVHPMQQHPIPCGWVQQQNTNPTLNVQSMQQLPLSYEQAQQQNSYPALNPYNQYM